MRLLLRALHSTTAFVLLCLFVVPVIFLGFFGFLFFFSTTSLWALVPGIVLAAFLPVAREPFPKRKQVAIALFSVFLCYLSVYQWEYIQKHLEKGEFGIFDWLEPTLILIFFFRCVSNRPSPLDKRNQGA
jgi:drug/metabolite transporter (DMT)-like permease